MKVAGQGLLAKSCVGVDVDEVRSSIDKVSARVRIRGPVSYTKRPGEHAPDKCLRSWSWNWLRLLVVQLPREAGLVV